MAVWGCEWIVEDGMKKHKNFRLIWGIWLCSILAIMIWWRAEWTPVQIGCWVVMLLAGLAALINNQRNEAFDNAVNIPLIAAVVVFYWSDTRTLRGSIILIPVTIYFVWIAVKPYYVQWKKSHGFADSVSESPAD